MPDRYDVIVAGLGGMGSAACYQLARRGQRVLGLEKFEIGHAMGSSHGLTRILRLAYFEGESYVPMVQRARELWLETGRALGEPLFFEVGAMDLAPADDPVLSDARLSCETHGLPYEALDAVALARRFPALSLPGGHAGILQPQSGFVASERAVLGHAALALHHGATLRAFEPLLGWEPTGDGVRVRTARGSYEAGRLILSPGAWIGRLVPSLAASTTVIRQALGWFAPRHAEQLTPEAFPVFTLKVDEGHYYGFPLWGHPGFKLGTPHYGDDVYDPDTPTRIVTSALETSLRTAIRHYVPAASQDLLGLKACMYTMTPDEHFIIDTLPDAPQVIVASPCSGHGFKFASVIGEILADIATAREPRFDLSGFALTRFLKSA